MTKTLIKCEVLRGEGSELVIPKKVTWDQAIDLLVGMRDAEEQEISITHKFEGIPWADGIIALNQAMEELFTFSIAKPVPGMFGAEMPPAVISVKTGPGPSDTRSVATGKFSLPVLDNAEVFMSPPTFGTAAFKYEGKRKFEPQIQALIARAEEIARQQSIYRGRALAYRRMEEDDEISLDFLPVPEDSILLLNRETELQLETSVWTLLEQRNECLKRGIPFKRSVLMFGSYGTGKTLVAHQTARIAVQNGITFLYADAKDLGNAYQQAAQFAPSVLFVEDLDQGVQDSVQLAQLSNILDGITAKGKEVLLICTTNHIDSIPAVLLRPGRIDAVVEVDAPDKQTAAALVKAYTPGISGDLEKAGQKLAGQIPAVVRECCERAKLYAVAEKREAITGEDVASAAGTMNLQMGLLDQATKRMETRETDADRQWKLMTKAASEGVRKYLDPKRG